jgi:hypothetical protein
MMNTYPLKAALHFIAAFCATMVAAGANEPQPTIIRNSYRKRGNGF